MSFLSFMVFQILNHRSLVTLSQQSVFESLLGLPKLNFPFFSFLFLENTNDTDGIQSYAFSSLYILYVLWVSTNKLKYLKKNVFFIFIFTSGVIFLSIVVVSTRGVEHDKNLVVNYSSVS